MKRCFRYVVITALFVAAPGIMKGCGGGGSSNETATASSTFTGSLVTSSSSSSSSLVQGFSLALSAAEASDVTVIAYSLTGRELAQQVIPAGEPLTYAMNILHSDWAGTEDTDLSSFKEPILIVASNGLSLYRDPTTTSGATHQNNITTDETLAAESLLKRLGGRPGDDFTNAVADLDPTCYHASMLAVFENPGSSGVGTKVKEFESYVQKMIDGRIDPADYGHNDFHDLFGEMFDGTVPDRLSTDLAASDPDDGITIFDKMGDIFERQFAGNGIGHSSLGALVSPAASTASGTSVCTLLKTSQSDGGIDASQLVGPMLAVDGSADLDMHFTDDNMSLIFGLLEKCRQSGGDCSHFERGYEVIGFLEGYNGSNDVCEATVCDPDELALLNKTMAECYDGTAAGSRRCGAGMFWTSKQIGYANFSDTEAEVWSKYWQEQDDKGWIPSNFSNSFYSDAVGVLENSLDSDSIKNCIHSIEKSGSYDFSSCFSGINDYDNLSESNGDQTDYAWGLFGAQHTCGDMAFLFDPNEAKIHIMNSGISTMSWGVSISGNQMDVSDVGAGVTCPYANYSTGSFGPAACTVPSESGPINCTIHLHAVSCGDDICTSSIETTANCAADCEPVPSGDHDTAWNGTYEVTALTGTCGEAEVGILYSGDGGGGVNNLFKHDVSGDDSDFRGYLVDTVTADCTTIDNSDCTCSVSGSGEVNSKITVDCPSRGCNLTMKRQISSAQLWDGVTLELEPGAVGSNCPATGTQISMSLNHGESGYSIGGGDPLINYPIIVDDTKCSPSREGLTNQLDCTCGVEGDGSVGSTIEMKCDIGINADCQDQLWKVIP